MAINTKELAKLLADRLRRDHKTYYDYVLVTPSAEADMAEVLNEYLSPHSATVETEPVATPESQQRPEVACSEWVGSKHEQTYRSLCIARDAAQNAHYALEEAEYGSALIYIAEAGAALAKARALIEKVSRRSESERGQHGEQTNGH